MTEQNHQSSYENIEESAMDKRLDAIGWGLFLMMIGGLWLMPEGWVPEGAWLIGTGLIILGLNAYRYHTGISVSGFWNVVGVIALASGTSDLVGVDLPVFPILLVAIGAGIILKPLLDR